MFPKGPRFEQPRVPDVPGPGSYNAAQDTLDNYKRGAFLEKTDRFVKDPLPKPSLKPSREPERYVNLQKKVEDIERIHLQEKKSHNAQLERLKQDIAHSQSQAAEYSDRADKQRKHNTTLESIIQDLKKVSTSDQAELKDSRHKIRLLEAERDKFISKQSELVQLKKSLFILESKRKDELKERDHRVVELEKQLLSATKVKDLLEFKLMDSKRTSVQQLTSTRTEMETLLEQAHYETFLAKEESQNLMATSVNREEHRRLMDCIVQEYAHLASQSVSSTDYHRMKHDYSVLQLRRLRLERKLANAEDQVIELTHLIRQAKDENLQQSQALSDALDEISILRTAASGHANNLTVPPDDTNAILDSIHNNIIGELVAIVKTNASTHEISAGYYQSQCVDLCLAFSVIDKELAEVQVTAGQYVIDLASALTSNKSITSRLESLQKEHATHEEEAKQTLATLNDLKTSTATLEAKVAEMQQKLDNFGSSHANELKKEKDMIQRLNTTIQKSRMAEEALREEIDELTRALTNAECYQEAYNSLSDEIGALLTRNEIAEEEVNRISQFNAEILGHNNPAQRIMYVDRIRRELAEAKQKIAMLTYEQENIAAQNNDLEHELEMYKSVRVPIDDKRRTTITRVGRCQ